MKVGKPKSKRVPVRLRQKIQKASAAKDRKRRKDAKKNPQWRSRLKKDPGIPNLFPYKGKVLAEIEESKRRKEEEALRKRELAKAQRQGKVVPDIQLEGAGDGEDDDDEVLEDSAEDVEVDEDEDEDEEMEQEDDSNPMAALLASAQARADAFTPNTNEDENDSKAEDSENEEWTGFEDNTSATPKTAPQVARNKSLPKQALADPIKAVSALLDRMQQTTSGMQTLMDYYQLPPLVTAGSDQTSRFLVEVARKRGRLGKGGVPNLHSAALTVLADLNEERLVLPATLPIAPVVSGKGEVQVVAQMAEPFRIEGLWGAETGAREEEMVVEG